MHPITNQSAIQQYRTLVGEMTVAEPGRENEFKPDWVRRHGWQVVPVEDTAHLSSEEIAIIVPVLRRAGYQECVAVATQSVDPAPACIRLSITEEEFSALNRSDYGVLRYLFTSQDRSWAISCGEWYNLFGAKPELLEALLGKPIGQARQEFFEYASLLATGQNPDESILQVAKQYANL